MGPQLLVEVLLHGLKILPGVSIEDEFACLFFKAPTFILISLSLLLLKVVFSYIGRFNLITVM